MPKFRKKPVIIEAIQYTGEPELVRQFMSAAEVAWDSETRELVIPTLEDGCKNQVRHVASPGDWIIRGVDGEFYACKPDIFEKTYEPAG